MDCSTCPVRLAQEISEAAAPKGVRFIDAPVALGVKAAEDGILNFMAGGNRMILIPCYPTLNAWAAILRYAALPVPDRR